MNRRLIQTAITRKQREAGVMLIEAMIAILIFSMGVLGIIGLQASANKASVDAKYRSEAALLANELIGRMWTSDRTAAVLATAFASPNGTEYKKWAWEGRVTGAPGTTAAPAAGTVLATLPRAGTGVSNPTVVINQIPSPVAASGGLPTSDVTITIFWRSPGETDIHSYVAKLQIGG